MKMKRKRVISALLALTGMPRKSYFIRLQRCLKQTRRTLIIMISNEPWWGVTVRDTCRNLTQWDDIYNLFQRTGRKDGICWG